MLCYRIPKLSHGLFLQDIMFPFLHFIKCWPWIDLLWIFICWYITVYHLWKFYNFYHKSYTSSTRAHKTLTSGEYKIASPLLSFSIKISSAHQWCIVSLCTARIAISQSTIFAIIVSFNYNTKLFYEAFLKLRTEMLSCGFTGGKFNKDVQSSFWKQFAWKVWKMTDKYQQHQEKLPCRNCY